MAEVVQGSGPGSIEPMHPVPAYFPRPIVALRSEPPVEIGDGTDYPLVLELPDAIEWYWRVREWTLDVNVLCLDNSETAVGTRVLVNHAYEDLGPALYEAPTTERGLPLARGTHANAVVADCGFFLRMWGALDADIYRQQFVERDGLWYPALAFSIGFENSHTTFAETSTRSGITLTVNEVEVPLYLADLLEAPQNFSGTITLNPTKWWEYRREGGSPVWDEDTGEKLQDHRIEGM